MTAGDLENATHRGRSFRLGFTCVLIAWATLNAISYFVWSEGWGNLLGTQPDASEAIGVPRIVWEEGPGVSSSEIDSDALAANGAIGVFCSILAGLAAARFVRTSGPLPETPPPTPAVPKVPRKLQFSLRALLMVAVVEALVFGAIRASVEARPVLLLLIYLLGPLVIVGVAHRLRDVVPMQRNLALAAIVLLCVPAVAVLGETIEGIGDFTKGIFGLYIFWVPECALILIVLLGIRRITTH